MIDFIRMAQILCMMFLILHPADSWANGLRNVNGVKIGMKLRAARKILFHEGWKKLIYDQQDKDYVNGMKSDLLKSNINEIRSCAEDRSFCTFFYSKGKKCLKMETEGEQIPNMRVMYLDFRCPEE
jgi:hypothetical protein